MILNLHFTSVKYRKKKHRQRSPDINIPERTWKYKITNSNNEYICRKGNC